MPLGTKSKVRLAECDPRLGRFVEAVMADVDAGLVPGVGDLTVLCGFRGQAEQDDAFARGASKLKWPRSKHNKTPALAVDIAPYPVDWKNVKAFEALRKHALTVASRIGVRIRVISWDLPHYELI